MYIVATSSKGYEFSFQYFMCCTLFNHKATMKLVAHYNHMCIYDYHDNHDNRNDSNCDKNYINLLPSSNSHIGTSIYPE